MVPIGANTGGLETTTITITSSSVPNAVVGTPEAGSPNPSSIASPTTYSMSNTNAMRESIPLALSSGDNTITISNAANVGAVMIRPLYGNTVALKVTPVAGTAGIPINRQAPFFWAFESTLSGGGSTPASFCINAGSSCVVEMELL